MTPLLQDFFIDKHTLMKDAEDEYFLDLYLFGPEAELNLNGCTISNLQEFMIGSAVVITDSVGTGENRIFRGRVGIPDSVVWFIRRRLSSDIAGRYV